MRISGDAVVQTLAGTFFVVDLVDSDRMHFGFSWDGEKITPTRFAVLRGKFPRVPLQITLDDDTELRVLPDTKVIMRDGTLQSAEDLSAGESLLPLYVRSWGKVPMIQDPGEWYKAALARSDRKKWRKVSRLVAEWKLGRRLLPEESVHALDGDNLNLLPENLDVRKQKKTRKPQKRVPKFAQSLFDAQAFLKEHDNHKVSSVAQGKSENLYSLTMIGSDNLSVGGIFVCDLTTV